MELPNFGDGDDIKEEDHEDVMDVVFVEQIAVSARSDSNARSQERDEKPRCSESTLLPATGGKKAVVSRHMTVSHHTCKTVGSVLCS